MQDCTPKPVAGYHVGGVIGIGTYGEVRYAHHASTHERVALKLIDLSRFSSDTSTLIMKEIKILKMIKHSHCIRIIEVKEQVPYSGTWCDACACTKFKRMSNGCCGSCGHGGADHSCEETRDVLIIIQELAAGGELFGLLMHCGAFPEEIARYYFKQLMDGLEHLHEQGIVHRDLKPENLVLDGSFNLKIVDFGLASFCDDTTGVLHSGVGSQPYSAPEVFYTKELYNGDGYNGQAADIWSCAVILFVMLTGRPPFMRPLAKTYGQNMRRCKHFVNLMKGIGYEKMSIAAKDFLMKLFRIHPDDRLSIDSIKRDPWFNGPIPSKDVMIKMMEERAHKVWNAQDKADMIQILSKIRAEMTPINRLSPSSYPIETHHDPFIGAETGISLLSLADCEEPVYRSMDIITPSISSQSQHHSFYDFDGMEPMMIKAVDMESWVQQTAHTPISMIPTETQRLKENSIKQSSQSQSSQHRQQSSSHTQSSPSTTTTTSHRSSMITDGKTPELDINLYHMNVFPQHSYTRMISSLSYDRILDILSHKCMKLGLSCHSISPSEIHIIGHYQSSHLILHIHLIPTSSHHTLITMHKLRGDMISAYHFYSTILYGSGIAMDDTNPRDLHIPMMLETIS